ncbi:DUF2993 domain-containing protein [Tessaracoccus sp. OS52]|uniref:LmeA family phospholipid-binding protein n=1 Tax=Tessaracoccus sp. OS52 TaxID=2886691 RepID=UPI001D10AF6C|nr:LmeA family phospholipid-binding protein [Tessaracoccus sp. OS52]MCC2592136.1 DUF2993 domain-containing protein [Tessaracoccus sp. OS52]
MARVVDWLIGALGMLFLLAIGVVVLWWVVSDPVAEPGGEPSATPTPTASASATAPADLAADEVWLGAMELQSAVVVLSGSTLTDVEAWGDGVRSGPQRLVVEQLEVRATVPFDTVAAELGGDSRVRAAEGGQAAVHRTVDVLGRQIAVVATGTVEVRDGLIVVEPRSIDLGGPDFLSDAIAALVREFVTIEQPVEGLPPNLVLRDVEVDQDGFRVLLTGQDVVLSEGG